MQRVSIDMYGYNAEGIFCAEVRIWQGKRQRMTPRKAKKLMARLYGATQFARFNRWSGQ